MSRKRETPIEGGPGSCGCCGEQHGILPLDALLAVGFGEATVTKDGIIVYDEMEIEQGVGSLWTCAEAERLASQGPDHDWRIHLVAPLSERHYQRQGNLWILYEKGPGFA